LCNAGNDDKSVEIWKRNVTEGNKSSLGGINSKNAAAKLSILSYKSLLQTGTVVERKLLSRSDIAINPAGTAPWLVVAVSDNGQTSTMADEEYGTSDDRTFIYLTDNSAFIDNTAGKIRGAICSIPLIVENTSGSELQAVDNNFSMQIFPNPCIHETTIRFNIEKGSNVSMDLYSLAGKKVLSMGDTYYTSGTHQLRFGRDNLHAGMYLLEMARQGHSELHKLIIK